MATLSKYDEVIAKGTVTAASERAYLSNQLLLLATYSGYESSSINSDTDKYLQAVQALCTTDVVKIKSGRYVDNKLKNAFFKELVLLFKDETFPLIEIKFLFYLAELFNQNKDWKSDFSLAVIDVTNRDKQGHFFYNRLKLSLQKMYVKPSTKGEWAFFYTKERLDFTKFTSQQLKTINLIFKHKNKFNIQEWEYLEIIINSCVIHYDNRAKFVKAIVLFFENGFPFLKNYNPKNVFYFVMWLCHSTQIRISNEYFDIGYNSRFNKLVRKLCHNTRNENWKNFINTPFCQVINFLPEQMLYDATKYPLQLIILLASGGNIRQYKFGIPMTKKMAHLYQQNPDYVYSLVSALGGSSNFAKFLSTKIFKEALYPTERSNIVRNFEAYTSFLKKIVLWEKDLIAYAKDNEKTFLEFMKQLFGYISHLIQDEPNFNLKGRTSASFIRLTEEYYEELLRARYSRLNVHKVWKGADYKEFESKDGLYKIIQITTFQELVSEGQVMNHCVGGYSGRCYIGALSIWSLRKKLKNETWKSEVTMEILNDRKIVQAKAKFNSTPENRFLSIIKEWSKRENLTFVKC